MAETPKPAPKPAPKLPLEERIRTLETDRRAGKSVPELDDAYREMDALTNKGYNKATGGKKAGGPIKKMVRGGGIESRGKTKGRFV